MKNISIIIAMLLIAFTVEAQSSNRSRNSEDRKKSTSTVRAAENKSTGREVRSATSSSASRQNNATRTQSRENAVRQGTSSRPSPAARPSENRNSDNRSSYQNRSQSDNRSRTVQTAPSRGNSGNSGTAVRNPRPGVVDANRPHNRPDNSSGAYRPRTAPEHATARRAYKTTTVHRVQRPVVYTSYHYYPIEYRRVHYPYRSPRMINIYWDVHMYHEYRSWYPNYNLWYYPFGYRIHTISAYDADRYIGEIARVYGKVSEVWFMRETGEYMLYIGAPYPYQDFTVILDYIDAKRFSRNPERFFTNRHIAVTGLISQYEGKPELVVKKRKQVEWY